MRTAKLAAFVAAVVGWALAATGTATAAPAPAWTIHTVAVPTNFVPGSKGQAFYETSIVNSGGAKTDGSPITLVQFVPLGLTVESVQLLVRGFFAELADVGAEACSVAEAGGREKVTCHITESLFEAVEPTRLVQGGGDQLLVHVAVDPSASGALDSEASVEGGGPLPASTRSQNVVSTQPASAGLAYFESQVLGPDGAPVTQAGAHPFQYVTTFAVNTEPGNSESAPFVPAGGNVKDITVDLPPGLVGNPTVLARCTSQEFSAQRIVTSGTGISVTRNNCANGAAVGYVAVQQLEGIVSSLYQPIFNLEPPAGMPAQFGFIVAGAPFFINTRVRSAGDYGVSAFLTNLGELKRVTSSRVVFWGVPGEPAHDPYRGQCLNEGNLGPEGLSLGTCPAGLPPKPFFTTPTSCGTPVPSLFSFDTWTTPGALHSFGSPSPANTGCESLNFSPSLTAVPDASVADSPTGLAVDLRVPQNENPVGLATPNLRDSVVALPAGVTVNPAAATGLDACSPAQVGLVSPVGSGAASFDANPAACPPASELGSVEVDTPLLDHPIKGGVYLAEQGQNPFGSLLAIYIAVFDPQSGVVVKLAGHVEADATTGRLTTHFDDDPRLPFEDLKLRFFSGPHAPLRTPTTCGMYTTESDMRPWSAPASGPDARPSDSFTVTTASGGGACANSEAALPHQPSFQAGTEVPLAGGYSPFVMRLARPDGSQPLRSLDVTLPKGVLANLTGVPYCPDGALAAAAGRSGRAELASPSCPAASQIGTARVGVGAGPQPFFAEGKVFWTGPYRDAPLSLAVVTPAVAGPLDLGTVVVRVALQVNPLTTQVTAVSDPFPTILQGIPLDIRDIRLQVNRNRFTLNPTSCESTQISGVATSTTGQTANLLQRFQVGGCKGLDFSPKVSLRLSGAMKRSGNPALRAVLTQPGGQAGVSAVTGILPRTEFIDNSHINNPCTRVQFNEGKCPSKSILGTATAYTPLLDQPLTGLIYFRSNGGERQLPDMVVALHGQVDANLIGFIDSVKKKGNEVSRVRTRFLGLPDVPVSKVVLQLYGGKRGLLENSVNLCKRKHTATIKTTGQNGKTHDFTPVVGVTCKKKKSK